LPRLELMGLELTVHMLEFVRKALGLSKRSSVRGVQTLRYFGWLLEIQPSGSFVFSKGCCTCSV